MATDLDTLKILFMGTPGFGATVLRRLAQSYSVVGVVTQPDRPAGRKNQLNPPEVKVAAQELGLPLLQLEGLRKPEPQAQLREFAGEANLFVVASFGMILPQAVLDIPALQCLNVHASLLPAYRGASPVAQAILDGLSETGVTIMKMEKGLDTGPMISRVVVPLASDETQPTLMDKLAAAGGQLLVETIPAWVAGQLQPQPQDSAEATHTGIIKKDDGRIDWQQSAVQIERKSRAYDPWPGIFTFWDGQLLKLGKCEVWPAEREVAPGQTALATQPGKGEQLVIGTGDDWLVPLSLQLPGKKMLPTKDFVRGYQHFIGTQLG